MRICRRSLAVFTIVLILALLGLVLSVTAGPLRQCGNACGIPGCKRCQVGDGTSQCTSWCDIEIPPDDGGGEDPGDDTEPPPGDDDDDSDRRRRPPPPWESGSDGSSRRRPPPPSW